MLPSLATSAPSHRLNIEVRAPSSTLGDGINDAKRGRKPDSKGGGARSALSTHYLNPGPMPAASHAINIAAAAGTARASALQADDVVHWRVDPKALQRSSDAVRAGHKPGNRALFKKLVGPDHERLSLRQVCERLLAQPKGREALAQLRLRKGDCDIKNFLDGRDDPRRPAFEEVIRLATDKITLDQVASRLDSAVYRLERSPRTEAERVIASRELVRSWDSDNCCLPVPSAILQALVGLGQALTEIGAPVNPAILAASVLNIVDGAVQAAYYSAGGRDSDSFRRSNLVLGAGLVAKIVALSLICTQLASTVELGAPRERSVAMPLALGFLTALTLASATNLACRTAIYRSGPEPTQLERARLLTVHRSDGDHVVYSDHGRIRLAVFADRAPLDETRPATVASPPDRIASTTIALAGPD